MPHEFRSGDWLVCVEPGSWRELTEGRLYQCIGRSTMGDVVIRDDLSMRFGYIRTRFRLATMEDFQPLLPANAEVFGDTAIIPSDTSTPPELPGYVWREIRSEADYSSVWAHSHFSTTWALCAPPFYRPRPSGRNLQRPPSLRPLPRIRRHPSRRSPISDPNRFNPPAPQHPTGGNNSTPFTMSTLNPSHPSLSVNKAAGLLHKGLPPADGFYWMKTRYSLRVVEVQTVHLFGETHRFAAWADDGSVVSEDSKTDFYFWGPITPPDELRNAERLMP